MLHIISNLDIGGAQEVVRTLLPNLREVGWEPVVATFRDGPLRKELEAASIPVLRLPARRHGILALPLAVAELVAIRRELVRIVRRHRIAVIQTHLLRSLDFLALTLASERPVRAVYWTVHNSRLDLRPDQLPGQRWLLGAKRLLYRMLYRAGGRRAAGFIAVSDEVAAAVRSQLRIPAQKVVTICNGVDTRRYPAIVEREEVRRRLGVGPDTPLLACVAKLHPQKGHRYLLDALGALTREGCDLDLLLVGDGPLRGELEAQAAALGVGGRVRFLGLRHDHAELLAASDAFVLPSLWEGLPMALLEAMASRLPVIATDVSGTRQVVISGTTGWLVAPGNGDALAAAVRSLLADPERASEMGSAGRERVERSFSAAEQARAHAALYESALEQSEAARG